MADFITVAETINTAIAGMAVGECRRDAKVADTAIQYGALACVGANGDTSCKLPASAGDVAKALGIVEYLAMREPGSIGVAAAAVATLVVSGEVWVQTEGTVAAGGAAFFRHTASGGNTTLGKARADSDTNTAAQPGNTMFTSSVTGAGLAKVRISYP